MKNPFHTLGLAEDADDRAVHAAWQRLNRELAGVPGRAAEQRRAELHTARDLLHDARSRVRARLFTAWEADVTQLLGPIMVTQPPAPPRREALLETLTLSLDIFQLKFDTE